MKILELRFKNLNSLYGEWIIDFRDPEYLSNGIFALTGPTGAGKSTVLDAVCLALYGATPRLGKITQSGNEIMSRQTGECYAEVVFESQAGSYRCWWSQARARKKSEGALQIQKHEISDARTGKTIESKLKQTAKVIEEKTGMDFDRFTRSILLAQGGFDTFLKADEEQKSKILEQITGTEIYSEISRRTHERQRQEREALNLLKEKAKLVEIMEEEQEKEAVSKLEAHIKKEAADRKALKLTEHAIQWLESIEKLKSEMTALDEEAVQLQSTIKAFEPEREKLLTAKKAATLDGLYATLASYKRHQTEDLAKLNEEKKRLPEIQEAARKQEESLKSAENRKQIAKEALQKAVPIIQKVRAMDQRLVDLTSKITEEKASCAKATAKIDTDKDQLKTIQEKAKTAHRCLEEVELYFSTNQKDEELITGYAGIEEQLGSLIFKHKEIVLKENGLKKAEEDLAQAENELVLCSKENKELNQKQEAVSSGINRNRNDLNVLMEGKLLREYRDKLESLYREKSLFERIATLEEQRSRLEDDSPCPLCGSHDHPYAKGNIPVPDDLDKAIEKLKKRIEKAVELDADFETLEKKKNEINASSNQLELRRTKAEFKRKSAESSRSQIMEELEALRNGKDQLKQTITKKLEPLGIDKIPNDNVKPLLDSLKSRLGAWQEKLKQKETLKAQLHTLESDILRLEAVLETQYHSLKERQEALKKSEQEHVAEVDKRQALFQDKNPDEEESRLYAALSASENSVEEARKLYSDLQQKLTSSNTAIEQLLKRVSDREPELKREENRFANVLKTAGFNDEGAYLSARIDEEKLELLTTKAKELDDKQTDINARKKGCVERLDKELARKTTDKPLDELKKLHSEWESSVTEQREIIASLKYKLDENAKAKEKIRENVGAIESQEKECRRWERLHGLIGSHKGIKFQKFAQGLTFEILVNQANLQLEKMTDRYLLVRSEDQDLPLDLNVIDNYQAGEERSTKNLSGGESFIVSLSLALGLSKMASKKVRVDSLFLDEGFGTLDEEALEVALETLSSLHQDGKLIGIISHVPALKERIGTQINIMPVTGGRSSLKGPGCREIAKI